jgi:hypothetical protein
MRNKRKTHETLAKFVGNENSFTQILQMNNNYNNESAKIRFIGIRYRK